MSIILRVLYKSCQDYAHFLCPGAEHYGRGAFCFLWANLWFAELGSAHQKCLHN